MRGAGFQALPHSEESEKAVLAALLLYPTMAPEVFAVLRVEDFYLEKHQAIFQAMAAVCDAYRTVFPPPIDLRTVQAQLELRGQWEMIGGLAYLTHLDLFLPDGSQTPRYVAIVKERSVKRETIRVANAMLEACFGGQEAPQVIGSAMGELQKLTGLADRRAPQQIVVDAREMARELRERADDSSPFQGFFTGLPSLDSVIVGLERKTLSLWIADPGAGKTAWSLQVAEAVNATRGRIWYGSLEMSKRALNRRLACRALSIPIWAIATGKLSSWQLDQIDEFVEALAERDFMTDDSTSQVVEFCARIRAEAAKGHAPDLIVFDYVQLGKPPAIKGDADWKANGINCELLREVAVDVDAHVLVLGQANEQGKLKGGGGWAESDLMVRIERPWAKTRDPAATPEERAAVIMAVIKNRLGSIGDVALEFDGSSQTFREPTFGAVQGEIF